MDTLVHAMPLAAAVLDPSGRITFANETMAAMTGWSRAELEGRSWFGRMIRPGDAGTARRLFREAVSTGVHPAVYEIPLIKRNGEVLLLHWSTILLRDHAGEITGLATFGEDITAPAKLWSERRQMSLAVEHADEAIVITSADGTITYVNPAYERLSGYGRAEVIGQNPRIVNSGLQSPDFYASLWATLTAGETWRGEMTNRRKDGTLYLWVGSIAPIRDADGSTVSYVGVQRDVTRERELEAAADREVRERAAIVAALERLALDRSMESSARAICDALRTLPSIRHAVIFAIDVDTVVPVAVAGPRGLPLHINSALPGARAAYLRDRAAQGPWAEVWRSRGEDGLYGRAVADAGVGAVAYVPLQRRGHLFGLLALTAGAAADAEELVSRLPGLTTFGSIASSRLAAAASRRRSTRDEHTRVEAMIRDAAFTVHYQPIFDLATAEMEIVGYEALLRPADGTPPDQLFAMAHRSDLGLELEEAVLTESLRAASSLPEDAWLSLNVSPEMVVATNRLNSILLRTRRRLVLEITEHAAVDSYEELRGALAALGSEVRLGVDDAGAGFASMRHIVELHPDIVKVDIGLVRSLDTDPMRRAMVAGLVYFATQAGCTLLAEGIETEGELAAVRSLDVRLGQGFGLGRPAPASALRTPGNGAVASLPRRRSARATGRPAAAQPVRVLP